MRLATKRKPESSVAACPETARAQLESCQNAAQIESALAVERPLARTAVDLEDSPNLEPKHIAEATQYRSLDRTYWA
jgi:predicted ATPase with chaperone activity